MRKTPHIWWPEVQYWVLNCIERLFFPLTTTTFTYIVATVSSKHVYIIKFCSEHMFGFVFVGGGAPDYPSNWVKSHSKSPLKVNCSLFSVHMISLGLQHRILSLNLYILFADHKGWFGDGHQNSIIAVNPRTCAIATGQRIFFPLDFNLGFKSENLHSLLDTLKVNLPERY